MARVAQKSVHRVEKIALLRRRAFGSCRDALAHGEIVRLFGERLLADTDRLARGLLVGCSIALGAPMTTASRMQIIRAGNPDLLPALEIPRSTAMSWIRRGPREVVSFDPDNDGKPALRDRVAKLERRIAMLTAVLRLVLALLRVSGFKLELSRVPDAAGKRRLLGAIDSFRLGSHFVAHSAPNIRFGLFSRTAPHAGCNLDSAPEWARRSHRQS
jgi:hypothetical protein